MWRNLKNKTMKIFKEQNGEFSWRKALTATAGFCFLFCVIGYTFGLPEIPAAYQAIIAGVFGAYFLKNKLRGV
jgi:hypothetical protein